MPFVKTTWTTAAHPQWTEADLLQYNDTSNLSSDCSALSKHYLDPCPKVGRIASTVRTWGAFQTPLIKGGMPIILNDPKTVTLLLVAPPTSPSALHGAALDLRTNQPYRLKWSNKELVPCSAADIEDLRCPNVIGEAFARSPGP